MSKKSQSVHEVCKLKQGYLGYLFKRTFQRFFKISGCFANHPDNLDSARLIKKQANSFLITLKNPVSQKCFFFFNINYIVYWESFQTVFSDFLKKF